MVSTMKRFVLIAVMASLAGLASAAPVPIRGVVSLATGSPVKGRVTISWPNFTGPNGFVPGGKVTVPITDNVFEVSLESNVGAGMVYLAEYIATSAGGTTWKEKWVVLNVVDTVLTLGQIRVNDAPPGTNPGSGGGTGPQGPQGLQGPKGDKGDTGSQGIQGIQGIKGDTGQTGPKGDPGDQGIQGIPGVKGDKGDTGSQGIQGIQGVKGDTGDPGTARYTKSFSGATAVSILGTEHRLGTIDLTVTCYGPDYIVEPDRWVVTPVTFDVTIYFVIPQDGRCVLR